MLVLTYVKRRKALEFPENAKFLDLVVNYTEYISVRPWMMLMNLKKINICFPLRANLRNIEHNTRPLTNQPKYRLLNIFGFLFSLCSTCTKLRSGGHPRSFRGILRCSNHNLKGIFISIYLKMWVDILPLRQHYGSGTIDKKILVCSITAFLIWLFKFFIAFLR